MSSTLQIWLIAAIVVYFALLIHLLRKKTLSLKYTLLWLLSGILMLVFAIFPSILAGFSSLIGIASPMNALFSVLFFCMLVILVSLTAIASKQTERTKQMAQALALLEERVRKLEKSDSEEEECAAFASAQSHK